MELTVNVTRALLYEREETELRNTAGLNVPVNLLFFNHSLRLHSLSSRFSLQHLLFLTTVTLSVGISRPPPMGLFLLYCTPACVSKGRNERFHWINGVVATQLMTSALSTGCCTGRPRDARTWFTMSRMIITDKVRVRDHIRRPRLLGYLCTLKQQVCELNRCSVGSLEICWNVLQFLLFIFLN